MKKGEISMTVSKKIGRYVKEKGYNLAEIARRTSINYDYLYDSLYSPKGRELRANELLPLCIFLDVDLRNFADTEVSEK